MAKNNKTRFFYVLYSDKTRVFDQSECAYYPIYIIMLNIIISNFSITIKVGSIHLFLMIDYEISVDSQHYL